MMLLSDLNMLLGKKLSKSQNLALSIHLNHLAGPCRPLSIHKDDLCDFFFFWMQLSTDSCNLTENFTVVILESPGFQSWYHFKVPEVNREKWVLNKSQTSKGKGS